MRTDLTVSEILQRKHFDCTEVIAGKDGLTRCVKWVHVVEVSRIQHLLKGDELILSTGFGWKHEEGLFLSFLQQLIESNAAALCIEIGFRTSPLLPEKIIDTANKHQFPIILFRKEVPFVEITQDIHSILINQQYQIISNLEKYSQELNKKLLTTGHYVEILKLLHHYLGVKVALVLDDKEIQFVPELKEYEKSKMIRIVKLNEERAESVARVPIQLLGSNYAELTIFAEGRFLNDFDRIILDRTGTALAQLLLRELFVEEKRKTEESEWITSWLAGESSEHEIRDYLSYHFPGINPKGTNVVICKLNSFENYSRLDLTYFKLYFRTFFEQQGFYLFSVDKRNQLIFIFVNKREKSSWKERLKEGINRFLRSQMKLGNQDTKLSIAVGKFVEGLNVSKSYQSAKETIRIQDQLNEKDQAECCFYEDLHVFRLISLLNHQLDLDEIVMEYLEPVLLYDEKYNGKLMETLKTYLDCNGSKKETAEKLFIVRQTLYHRIEKLEKLLGSDFMISSEKRLAIEFMIRAFEFLNPSPPKSKQIKIKQL